MYKDYSCLGRKTLWLGGVGMKQAKCPECKKKFMHSPEHVYRRDNKFYCSYTCFRKEEHRRKNAEEGAPSRQVEAARALVEKCSAKVKLYTEKVNGCPKGTRERAHAQAQVRLWRQKLDDAREYRMHVEESEKERAKCTKTQGAG